MQQELIKKLFIQGITTSGKKFRPSDWAERLCCSVSYFQNEGEDIRTNISCIYSPYAIPVSIGNNSFVMIDERLKELEPRAYRFLINFAKDNDLPILEACELTNK